MKRVSQEHGEFSNGFTIINLKVNETSKRLNDFSYQVLQCIYDLATRCPKIPITAKKIASIMHVDSVRQVDAAITRGLISKGMVRREKEWTEIQQKEFKKIVITEDGKKYIEQGE